MVTYDTKTKTARELKEEISGLKKKIKVIDAEDRDLRLRITAFKTSLEKMNTMSVSLRWMKSRLSQSREKGGRLESDYDEIEIVGLCTDICVVSNALLLKAFAPELKITVDASCCAGVRPETHKAALETMKMCQINVIVE